MKKYEVTVELDIITIRVSATTKTDAKRKALAKLGKMNPSKLIRKSWPDNKKEINVEIL